MSCSVSISIVTFRPDLELLARLLVSIGESISVCKANNLIGDCRLTVVDNSIDESVKTQLERLSRSIPLADQISATVEFSKRNLGYGNGHNRAIFPVASDYHLVLNPDVLLEHDALPQALQFMEQHKQVGLLTPYATGTNGERLYLCKRFPTVLDLLLRGFAPTWLRSVANKRLEHYEMRDLSAARTDAGIPIASGCFMLIRGVTLQKLGGFDPRFFLYFEDFDLSLRLGKIADIAYVPAVKIIHYGGDAARKGPRHIYWFIRSAVSFFNLHGWKLW